MARGGSRGLVDSARGGWRDARERVERRYRGQLRDLAGAELYRLGDVDARLLFVLGIDTPVRPWQSERLDALLPARSEQLRIRGLTGVLVDDGLRPVPTIRERLLDLVSANENSDAAWEQALQAFRVAAAASRNAEIDWLAQHLVPSSADSRPQSAATEHVRGMLVELWFSAVGRGPAGRP